MNRPDQRETDRLMDGGMFHAHKRDIEKKRRGVDGDAYGRPLSPPSTLLNRVLGTYRLLEGRREG